jgi:hypothetical protein
MMIFCFELFSGFWRIFYKSLFRNMWIFYEWHLSAFSTILCSIIDKNYVRILHVVRGIFPHWNMKFHLYFAYSYVLIWMCWWAFFIIIWIILPMGKRLTNTFKLAHGNEQNTNETPYLSGKEFHTWHAISLYNFCLW